MKYQKGNVIEIFISEIGDTVNAAIIDIVSFDETNTIYKISAVTVDYNFITFMYCTDTNEIYNINTLSLPYIVEQI